MNTQRIILLGLAAVGAGGVALLAHSVMGGGTPKVAAAAAPTVAMSDVLVAASDLQPGQHLDGSQVRWAKWPKSGLDSSLITKASAPAVQNQMSGAVVREPIVAGEPITNAKVVHTDSVGIMAASLTPGTRAVSIPVTVETGAGGFILPNDRVDVLATVEVSSTPRRFRSAIILGNIRVLAMDQTFKQDANQKAVLAKSATLELTPEQAELLEMAQATGSLSLALRSLADSSASALAASALGPSATSKKNTDMPGIIRYGLPRPVEQAREE